ncbi:hypothetical protein GIB67_023322 [Kingdonia uniflora]|uniref:Protein kinase domain-containing protein n=1 Tax=Kingdonia uniflora TaxID=39325 RepID=A0A7J7NEJ0_9MAGN|nr:hypothetical protein GIB67_023322 [Kingdonia uniflora]
MSPESVSSNVYETGADIWALGCVVSELVTGKPSWSCRSNIDISGLLYRIGFGEELPVIPDKLCDDGKDFLIRYFARDPMTRWTTEMLLNHSFITFVNSDASPRSAFDFPEWSSPSLHSRSLTCSEEEWDCSTSESTVERIQQLDTEKLQSWSFTSSWIDVRDA